jgi:hypothetical protein
MMISLYFVIGLALFLSDFGIHLVSGTQRIVLASLVCCYGAFRVFKFIKGLKADDVD